MIENVQALTGAAESAMGAIAAVVASVSNGQTTLAAAVEEPTATNRNISRAIAEAVQQAQQVTAELASFVEASSAA